MSRICVILFSTQFNDALFSFVYQNKVSGYINKGLFNGGSTERAFTSGQFKTQQELEILLGNWTNSRQNGTMLRRLDELDIILNHDYSRDYDLNRYGDIWNQDWMWER